MPDIEDCQISEKLIQARKAMGMSTRRVAEILARAVSLSHTTIANYESGRSQPTMEALSALADVYQRPLMWFIRPSASLTGIRYRNRKSRVGVRDLAQFEAIAQKWVEAYRALEDEVKKPLQDKKNIDGFNISSKNSPNDVAKQLRARLELRDSDPVFSVVDILERFGVRVLELPTPLAIDGMAASAGNEYVVVLNPAVSNERSRLNAAHELGHILFGDCSKTDIDNNSDYEKQAFEFASCFLLTDTMLKEAFKERSMVRLVKFKERFGISIAAMVYRAEKHNIIKKNVASHLWVEINRRGWRTNEPGHVKEDRATRFEQLLEDAISKQVLTWQSAAQRIGVREDELRQRVELALGIYEPPTKSTEGGDGKPILRLVF